MSEQSPLEIEIRRRIAAAPADRLREDAVGIRAARHDRSRIDDIDRAADLLARFAERLDAEAEFTP